MQRAYNVWWSRCNQNLILDDGEWSFLNKDHPGYSEHYPKRLTLKEAQEMLTQSRLYNVYGHYTILEIDSNNRPIIPKCRMRK